MNPPYSGPTLHLQFIENGLKISNKVDVVCPASWLDDYGVITGFKQSPKAKYVNSLGKYIKDFDYFDEYDFSQYFNISAQTPGMIALFDKDNKDQNLYKSVVLNKINDYDKEIIEKCAKPVYLDQFQSCSKMYRKNKNNKDYKYFIKLTRVHGNINKKDFYDLIAPDIKYSLNVNDKEEKEIYFRTKEEAINFFESLKTNFCKYLKKLECYGSGDFNSGIPFMDDYTKPWTTHRFCKYFKISKEAEEHINNFFDEYNKKFEK